MRTSEDEGAQVETDRALQPLGENPSDDAVREYFVATLETMGADEAVIEAARDALQEMSTASGASAGKRAVPASGATNRPGD